MKSIRFGWSASALAFALLSMPGLIAHDAHKKDGSTAAEAKTLAKGEMVKVTEKDAAWAAKERKTYPMTVCLTSDEKLGSMGDNAEFIYREKGKPDRLLIFCCDGCEDDFKKEPAKYLAKLDAAAKGKGSNKNAADAGHKAKH